MLKQRDDAKQARSAALSRVEELRGEQKAEAEKEVRKREAAYESSKQLEELRRMSKFKVRMSEMSKNGQVAELQSLYASFASKMAGAQDAATWQRASLGAGIVQQAIAGHSAEKLASL